MRELDQDGARIWTQALAELQSTMSQPSYTTWLRDTRCLDFDGAVLTMGSPTRSIRSTWRRKSRR